GVEEARGGLAARHLCGDLDRQIGNVERLNFSNPRHSLDQTAPVPLKADPEGCHQPHTGHHDASHILLVTCARAEMAAACDLEWGSPAGGGSAVRFDEADRILHRHDLLGRVIRDLAPELLFEGHHQLDGVEAVGAQIVDEAGVFGHLRFVDAQMLDDDLLDPISDVTHPLLSSVACWKLFTHRAPWRSLP